MKDLRKQTHKKMAHGSGHPIATCFGILGWLFHGILSVITAGLIIMAIVGLLIYAKVKPELDQCREIAYDKLAQMERSDFSMLSDTVVRLHKSDYFHRNMHHMRHIHPAHS